MPCPIVSLLWRRCRRAGATFTKGASKRIVELIPKFLVGGFKGCCVGADDDVGSAGDVSETFAHEVSKLAFDAVASGGTLDFALGYDETDEASVGILVGSTVHDHQRRSGARSLAGGCPEVSRVNHAVRAGQHLAAPVSGGQACATLATTARNDGAAGAGAHAQTEAVRLGTTTVVGLESPLGHDSTPRGERGNFPRSSVRCVDAFSEVLTSADMCPLGNTDKPKD